MDRDSTRRSNDRIGFGIEAQLTDRIGVLAEASDGSLGAAGRLEFGYRPDADTVTTIGYRLDPMRRYDATSFSGRDKGSLTFGTSRKVSEQWSYTGESIYSAFGSRPSLTSGYGVTYTPNQRWSYDGMITHGESQDDNGTTLERRGLSIGLRYNHDELVAADLRAEWRDEKSDRPGNALDRETWLLSGIYENQTSEDWRFVSSLDMVISESDQSSFRDGRYIEARLGYAWRPVSNDRINALFSYTYLEDLPGADQVNIDGNLDGPEQRSHILNSAISWKADPQWTLGAKYGFRLRESADRGTNVFTSSEAHLLVVRADYHVVHNWDIMGELRGLWTPSSNTQETSVLISTQN